MRKTLKVQVKKTSYTLALDVGDDKVEIMPTSRCLCVRTITGEFTLERDKNDWFSGGEK